MSDATTQEQRRRYRGEIMDRLANQWRTEDLVVNAPPNRAAYVSGAVGDSGEATMPVVQSADRHRAIPLATLPVGLYSLAKDDGGRGIVRRIDDCF